MRLESGIHVKNLPEEDSSSVCLLEKPFPGSRSIRKSTLYMPEKLTQAFDQQRTEATIHLRRLESTCAELPGEQIYNRMSLEIRLRQLKAVLEWLDECQGSFQQD